MRKDYYKLVHDLKEDIASDIKSIVEKRGGTILLPNPMSNEEFEECVYVQAHVDASSNTELCAVNTLTIDENGHCSINLYQDYIGSWNVELSELSIDDLVTIYDFLTEE